MNHMHRWTVIRLGTWPAWGCACGSIKSTTARLVVNGKQSRRRGPGRPKGSYNEPFDISESEIERRFLLAKAAQKRARVLVQAAQ